MKVYSIGATTVLSQLLIMGKEPCHLGSFTRKLHLPDPLPHQPIPCKTLGDRVQQREDRCMPSEVGVTQRRCMPDNHTCQEGSLAIMGAGTPSMGIFGRLHSLLNKGVTALLCSGLTLGFLALVPYDPQP